MPRRVDYLFAAMRSALFGGVGIGVVSTASLHVAAGGGSALAACLSPSDWFASPGSGRHRLYGRPLDALIGRR